MPAILVLTPCGPAVVWGIEPGKVVVEHDWQYLVSYKIEEVEGVE